MKIKQARKRHPCNFGTPDTDATAPQENDSAEAVTTPTRSKIGQHRGLQAGIDGIKAARAVLDS